MISVTVKAALLVHFLLTIAEVSGQCPNFWYSRDEATNEIVGFIEIPSAPRGVTLDLSVGLSIAVALPSKYVGRLELAQSKEDSVRAVNEGRPLRYRIHFPLPQPIPVLTAIRFNGQNICSGPRATGQIVTSIVLNHTLYPPGVLPLSQDQGNMILNNPIMGNGPYPLAPSSKPVFGTYPQSEKPVDDFYYDSSMFDNYPPRPIHGNYPQPSPPSKPMVDNYQPGPPLNIDYPRPSAPSKPSVFDNRPRPTPPKPPYEIPPVNTAPATPATTTVAAVEENDDSECGKSALSVDRINLLVAKGTKTSHGQWPWLAAIFIVRPTYEFQCEGTLVSHNHVITAAHCFQLNNANLPIGVLAVSLGRHHLRNFFEEGSRNMEVAEYRLHPDYDTSSKRSADADLAVIVLRESVQYTRWIKPICLWSGPTELEHVVGKSGYVVGWGRDENGNPFLEEPRMSKSPIVSHAVCFWSNPGFVSFTSNRTFCAGLRDGSGPCNGDSGSGFVMYDRNRYYLRGVVSGSLLDSKTMSCDLTEFVVYVDVAKHLDWIRKQIYT